MLNRREQWSREYRQDLLAIFQTGADATAIVRAPATALDWRLDAGAFDAAVVELLRANDDIPIRELLTAVLPTSAG